MHHRPLAGFTNQPAFQQRGVLITHFRPARAVVLFQPGLDLAEHFLRDNGFVLALEEVRVVFDAPRIDRIRQ